MPLCNLAVIIRHAECRRRSSLSVAFSRAERTHVLREVWPRVPGLPLLDGPPGQRVLPQASTRAAPLALVPDEGPFLASPLYEHGFPLEEHFPYVPSPLASLHVQPVSVRASPVSPLLEGCFPYAPSPQVLAHERQALPQFVRGSLPEERFPYVPSRPVSLHAGQALLPSVPCFLPEEHFPCASSRPVSLHEQPALPRPWCCLPRENHSPCVPSQQVAPRCSSPSHD